MSLQQISTTEKVLIVLQERRSDVLFYIQDGCVERCYRTLPALLGFPSRRAVSDSTESVAASKWFCFFAVLRTCVLQSREARRAKPVYDEWGAIALSAQNNKYLRQKCARMCV